MKEKYPEVDEYLKFMENSETKKHSLQDTLIISDVGPKEKYIGAFEFANTNQAVPEGREGVEAVSLGSVSLSEALNNTIIMKIGCNVLFSKGNLEYFDDNAGVYPIIENSKTLIPLRTVSEKLGADVSWNDENRTVTVNGTAKNAAFIIGVNTMIIDGKTPVALQQAPIIKNSRTLIPLRDLCETLLSKYVYWFDDGLIILSDNELDLKVNKGNINLISEVLSQKSNR